MAATDISLAYVNQFSANVRILAQQTESRLMRAVDTETITGNFGYFDQVGPVDPVQYTSRHDDTPLTEVPHARRQLAASDWIHSELIDKQDTIRMLTDPESRYVQMFAAGMNRQKDRTILAGMGATAYTGQAGGTAVTFPSSNQIAVNYVESGSAVNSSLTIGKLRSARQILMDAGVEDGGLYIACRQREINSLLRTTEVGSIDYNKIRALEDGEITKYMGFEFILMADPSNAIVPRDGSGNILVYAWSKSGCLYGTMEEPDTNAAPDPGKNFNTRVHMRATFGAIRMEEARVVQIACHPTTF